MLVRIVSLPAEQTRQSRFGLKLLLIFAFWTVIGLSFAGQFFISSSQLGRPISWRQALGHSLADWYVFALLSFIPVLLARRFSLDGAAWLPRVVLHFAAGAAFSLAYVATRTLVGIWQSTSAPSVEVFSATFGPLLVKTWHFNFLIYWVIITVCHALAFYRRDQQRSARTADLERRLAEARLQALQMQLNPHFLFNTLHAISSLMHQDVDAADRMISRLSELLRYALESTDQHEVALKDELAFLNRYLEIEQTRFGERLRIEQHIDPRSGDLLVPNLILQPLVENAIKYGIEPFARPGLLIIESRLEAHELMLEIRDSGRVSPDQPVREGVGLSNTRARVRQLYGDADRLQIMPDKAGGMRAVLRLPIREIARVQQKA